MPVWNQNYPSNPRYKELDAAQKDLVRDAIQENLEGHRPMPRGYYTNWAKNLTDTIVYQRKKQKAIGRLLL